MMASLYFRLDVLAMKARGKLPQFSWVDLASMMGTSSDLWPSDKLVRRTASSGALSLYETPIGPVGHGSQEGEAKILGLLVLEELRGTYERAQVKIQPGDIVIDLGANVGAFTRFALSRGAAKVIAFEPEPRHLSILRLGFAPEIEQGRVVLVEAGAWRERTTLRFHSAGLVSQVDGSGELEIQAVRIDDVVRELGLGRVDFIKADIEGAERHALSGASETITTFGPRMALCVYHLSDDLQVMTAAIQQMRPYKVSVNAGRNQAFYHPV
jgi:FkbM family methyltransferase